MIKLHRLASILDQMPLIGGKSECALISSKIQQPMLDNWKFQKKTYYPLSWFFDGRNRHKLAIFVHVWHRFFCFSCHENAKTLHKVHTIFKRIETEAVFEFYTICNELMKMCRWRQHPKPSTIHQPIFWFFIQIKLNFEILKKRHTTPFLDFSTVATDTNWPFSYMSDIDFFAFHVTKMRKHYIKCTRFSNESKSKPFLNFTRMCSFWPFCTNCAL